LISIALWLAMLGLAVWTMRRSIHFKDRTELARSFLRFSRCPSCAYRIAGLEAEDDGCVVCPECGAAWRVGGCAGVG